MTCPRCELCEKKTSSIKYWFGSMTCPRCELCEKKTSSIKYWFGSMTCPSCYDLQRSNPQTILVSNLQD
jgi:late competence protein required for DNA uptake (superfamily II DNA/RNA helicase)